MNTNNVVSADAAGNLTGKEYRVVQLTSGGVDLAAAGDEDKVIGTLLRAQPHQESGTYAGKAVAVQLKQGALHYATLGNTSASITKGATLVLDSDGDNPGKLIPGASDVVALAWEALTGADNAVIRVVFV